MSDLFHAAFHQVNLLPTILLLLVILYWIMVIVGALDLGFGDFDIEMEVDVDADFDVDTHIEVDGHVETNAEVSSGPGLFNEILSFFNLGKVPFMVFMTALCLPLWFISMNVNHYMGISVFWISFLILIPNFMVSLMISKIATTPFVGIFNRLNDDAMHKSELVGKIGRVTLRCDSKSIGQIEVRLEGESFILTAKTREGIEIPKGAQAIIVEQASADYFIIAPFDS